MKKLFFSALLISTALFISTPAISGTWQVRVPADSPFMSCTILFLNHGGSEAGSATISRGGTGTWGTSSALSYAYGRCSTVSVYLVSQIQGRTCTGIDYKSIVAGGIECNSNLLKLKICPKVSNPDPNYDYHYGFCPD